MSRDRLLKTSDKRKRVRVSACVIVRRESERTVEL